MTKHYELNTVLSDLKRITGLSFELNAKTPEEAEEAALQIHRLCAAYKEKYDKTHFFRNILYGSLSSYEINEQCSKLRIDPVETRLLFLLETKTSDSDTTMTILKHLFPSQTGSYLIPVSDTKLVLLYPYTEGYELIQFSNSIIDTLNMEALTSVQIACSAPIHNLTRLSEAYHQADIALTIGRLFNSEQNVFIYNQLGIGRLIYQLPISVCDDFLHEIFTDEIPDSLEPELSATIERFLQNNLNIAETARQLHMHRNTLIYRLDQVKKRTGLDLRNFEDAMTFKTATMVMNYRNQKQKGLL